MSMENIQFILGRKKKKKVKNIQPSFPLLLLVFLFLFFLLSKFLFLWLFWLGFVVIFFYTESTIYNACKKGSLHEMKIKNKNKKKYRNSLLLTQNSFGIRIAIACCVLFIYADTLSMAPSYRWLPRRHNLLFFLVYFFYLYSLM